MSKDHAEYLSDEELAAEVAQIAKDVQAGKINEDESERDAYFSNPANAEEIRETFARMDETCHEVGLQL